MKYLALNATQFLEKTLMVMCLLSILLAAPAQADNRKFVYVYNNAGELIKPLNAANNCPSPDGDSGVATDCYGVEVDQDGRYSSRFANKDLDTKNLTFVANEYDYLAAGEKGATRDTFVLLDSKRRIDKIGKSKINKGVDINRVAEATVKAFEKVRKLPKGKKGSVNRELASVSDKIDARNVNRALGNDQDDNDDSEDTNNTKKLIATHQEKMDDTDEEDLVSIATVVLENKDDSVVKNYVRKNVKQALVEPASLKEVAQRVFSHVSKLQTAGTDNAVMFLETDKYIVFENEQAQLTTINSLNAARFFGYSWEGVTSITSTATFSKAGTGGYIVCATGEISGGGESSTDCIRLAVRNVVDAVARTESRRVGTGNTIKLSASLSVGVTGYLWSGAGTLSAPTSEVSMWTAPEEPGTYEISLEINGGEDADSVVIEVFDVVPVAVAAADKYVAMLDAGQASVSLSSGSISTDGSPVDALLWEVMNSPASSITTFSNSTGVSTSFSANLPGEYNVRLTAIKRGFTDFAELTLRVREPDAPIAIAGADATIYRNQTYRLDAGLSTASQGLALGYQWTVDGGVVANPSSQVAGFSSNAIGSFKVDLLVTEGNKSSTDSLVITVKNRIPSATDDNIIHSMTTVYEGQLTAADPDTDTLEYVLVTEPGRGGVTIDEVTGAFSYMPGGTKACKFSSYMPVDSDPNSVPVIKLCADKNTAAVGETVNLTISNSINASKFSGFSWNVDVTQINLTTATYTSTESGMQHVCITGNIGQSSNTSTACIDINIDPSLSDGDSQCRLEDEDYGLLDGHFDVDTSNFISKVNSGATSKHTHEYDDKFDVTGVSGLSMQDKHADIVGTIKPDQKFKLIVINADLSTGARLSINQIYDHRTPSTFQLATAYDDTAFADLPVYSLSGVAGTTRLTDFSVNFDKRAIVQKELHPTNTRDVKGNVPGKLGEWRNGAFVVQAVIVDDNGSDAFTTDTSLSSGGVQGAATSGLLWELTMFWHWDGPSYHQSDWDTYVQHGQLNEDDNVKTHSGSCGSVEQGYEDSFQFRVSDGLGNSNIATVRFNMDWVNHAPVADDLSITVTEDTTGSGDVNATDSDDNILAYTISENGSLGTATIVNSVTGDFTYTPNANTIGVDTVTYSVDDGFQGIDNGVITITIENVNDRPIAFMGNITTDEDVATGGMLTGRDDDAGDTLEFRLDTIPSKGDLVLTDSATGAFTYTPHQDKNGSDVFYFVVFDGLVESNTAPIHIDINPVNDAPVAEDQGPLVIHADTTLDGKVKSIDVDKDVLVYTLVATPGKGSVTLNGATGEFVYDPVDTQSGADSFTFRVDDGVLTSNTATVTLDIRVPNLPPTGDTKTIKVFEGVKYANVLTGNDPEGAGLTFTLAENGLLGEAEITNNSTGEFTYIPAALSSGKDVFTFTVNDGDKDSEPVRVDVEIIPLAKVCPGPGNSKQDQDGDGYADYVELAYSTDEANPAVMPNGSDPVIFLDDNDGDGFSDVNEMWLKSLHGDSASMPCTSTLKSVPRCLNPLYDEQGAVLQAFNIITPTVNMNNGDTVASFALTVMDNAAGVNTVNVVLTSPSGVEMVATATPSGSPLVFYGEFSTKAFNAYAEAGEWTVTSLKITDSRGNEGALDTTELTSLGYDTVVTLINDNSDVVKPGLTSFNVLTPTLVVTPGNEVASFNVVATDNLAGIARIAVTLQSPSGRNFKHTESPFTGNPVDVDVTLNTTVFSAYAEQGLWQVTELLITDEAGNTLHITGALLDGKTVDVTSTPDVPSTFSDIAISASTITIWENCSYKEPVANFVVNLAEDNAGINKVILTLQSPSNKKTAIEYSILGTVVSINAPLTSVPFAWDAEAGDWQYYELEIIDGGGNSTKWNKTALSGLSYNTAFTVVNDCTGIGHGLTAKNGAFTVDEDAIYSGSLVALDEYSHPLTYYIVDAPKNGSVSITNRATGTFNYTGGKDFNGNDSFTFKVDDGYGDSNYATVKATVNAVDDPTIAEDMDLEVIRNVQITSNLVATDVDGPVLNYELVSGPANGEAGITNAATGAYYYNPTADYTGPDSLTFRASDSNTTSDVATVNISVVPDIMLTDFDVLTPVVSNGKDPFYVASNITLSKAVSLITNMKVNLVGPSDQIETMIWINQSQSAYPATVNNFLVAPSSALEPGIWAFKDLLVKRQGEDLYEVVKAANDEDIVVRFPGARVDVRDNTPPVANRDDDFATSLDIVRTETMTASDVDGDNLTYRLLTSGSIGTAVLTNSATGEFRYIPGGVGTDTFTFRANDGLEDSNEGLVTITVTVGNGIPVAHPATINVRKGEAKLDNQLAASDRENDTLTYSIVTPPAEGRIDSFNSLTGTYNYVPDSDFDGTDSFTFRVNDGEADSNTATVNVEEENRRPEVEDTTIYAFENTVYNGTIVGIDPDGDTLTYEIVTNASLGAVVLDAESGAYTYTPVTDAYGNNSFIVRAFDGVLYSANATITVQLMSRDQACGVSGIVPVLDTDGDGYVDVIETAFGRDSNDAASTPAGLSASELGVLFTDDDDGDTHKDFIEVWMGSDSNDSASTPAWVMDACFNGLDDGIKPRLIGFDIVTPAIDIAADSGVASFTLSLLDNASGIKRARVNLLSPGGVYVTGATSFTDSYPLLSAVQVDTNSLGAFAEPGVWEITGITLYDEAGNRLDLTSEELSGAGFDTGIVVSNSNEDTTPPTLQDFSLGIAEVHPGTTDGHMTADVTVLDSVSGLSSVRIDFISVSGTVVSASQTLSGNPTSGTVVSLDTGPLSQHLEAGLWTVYGLLLVDAAGNSVQLADTLGDTYTNTVSVTNTDSDAVKPTLEALSVLTPEVLPASGDTRMRFGVTAADNAAGIEKIRVDITGPSGQVTTAWGVFTENYPLNTTSQVETAVLSTLTEAGTWSITAVEILDDAGNSSTYTQNDLLLQGYPVTVDVSF